MSVQTQTLLKKLRNLATQNGDGIYGSLQITLDDIDAILSAENLSEKYGDIRLLIAPTSNLQDLSIDCGWEDHFLSIADKIDSEINNS